MHKYLLIILTVLVFGACTPKQPEGGFILHGEISNLADGYLYYPKGFVMNKDVKLDSVLLENGKFTLVGKVDKPGLVRFYTKDFSAFFMLENSEMFFTADASLEYNDPERISVQGSVSDSLNRAYRSDFMKATYKDRPGIIPSKRNRLISDFEKRIELYPNNWSSLYAAFDLCYYLNSGNNHIEDFKKIVEALESYFKNERQFREILRFTEASKKRLVGEKFVDYSACKPDGKEVKLKSLLDKGYIFVDCWASWCGPCRNEMPTIREIYRKYKNKGFQVLSVSFDSNTKLWQEAIRHDDISEFINVSELSHYNNTVANTYRINAIPDNFLLDKEGRIVANGLSTNELSEILDSLHNEVIAQGKN